MSKEDFHKWIASFVVENILHIGNTPAQRPEGVPLDTVLITVDVRSVPRERLPAHARKAGDERLAVLLANATVDGVTAAERFGGGPDSYEVIVMMPTDEP